MAQSPRSRAEVRGLSRVQNAGLGREIQVVRMKTNSPVYYYPVTRCTT